LIAGADYGLLAFPSLGWLQPARAHRALLRGLQGALPQAALGPAATVANVDGVG